MRDPENIIANALFYRLSALDIGLARRVVEALSSEGWHLMSAEHTTEVEVGARYPRHERIDRFTLILWDKAIRLNRNLATSRMALETVHDPEGMLRVGYEDVWRTLGVELGRALEALS